MHGDLEPEEKVLKWDIEDMKKSYKEGAKDYDRIIKQMKDEKEENEREYSDVLEHVRLAVQVIFSDLNTIDNDFLDNSFDE